MNPWAEFSYYTFIHSSITMTPFEVVYSIPPPSVIIYILGTSNIHTVGEYLLDRDTILRVLHHNISMDEQRMKSQADQHRREVSFIVGDYVYLKLEPSCQESVTFRPSLKLAQRFFGPYQIVKKIGPVACRLKLPGGSI